MSKIKLDDIIPASGSIINIPGNLNVTGDITSSGTSTLGNTVVGGGTTELIVNGDARITGILTVGTSSLTIDGDAGTINGIPYATAGPLSNRNLIINGAMQVAQRGTSSTSTNYAVVDRFATALGGSGAITSSQSSDSPAGFSNSFKIDVDTADTLSGGEELYLEQRIEAQNLQHLDYGTSSAKTLTLSFWVKSNQTGQFSAWFYQPDVSRDFFVEYTVSTSGTWEYKTVTIPGDASGVINNDTGTGFQVRFYLGAGPDRVGTAPTNWSTHVAADRVTSNQVQLTNNTSNYWAITGIQLETGSVATPFEHRSFGDELKRCERYYEKSYTYVSPPGTATSNGALEHRKTSNTTSYTGFNIRFGTRKRTTPTIGLYNTNNSTEGQIRSDGVNVAANDVNTNEMGFIVNTTVAQGANVIQSMHYTADAEL